MKAQNVRNTGAACALLAAMSMTYACASSPGPPIPKVLGEIVMSPSSSKNKPIVMFPKDIRAVDVAEANYSGGFTVSGNDETCLVYKMTSPTTVTIFPGFFQTPPCLGIFTVADSLGNKATGYAYVMQQITAPAQPIISVRQVR